MPNYSFLLGFFWLTLVFWTVEPATAHHVLGRPASSLNEDSNTPSSIQNEVRVGDYLVNYMVYPAFPKPGENGQINVTVEQLGSGAPFDGKVTFTIRDDAWYAGLGFAGAETDLGAQVLDDHIFRQRVVFPANGPYRISARFDGNGEPHTIEFPVRIGEASAFGPIGIAIGGLLIVLVSVSLIQRRRSLTGKLRSERQQDRDGTA